jgi:hypothetical protein
MFASYGDKFEAVSVNDIAVDDISAHLKFDALIHSAAPHPGKRDLKALLSVSASLLINCVRHTHQNLSSGGLGWIFEHHTSR